MSRTELRITHVAIWVGDNLYSLPKPNRHVDVIKLAIDRGEKPPVHATGHNSGFLDSNGHFRNRFSAGGIAHGAGQTKTRIKTLTSEDVW